MDLVKLWHNPFLLVVMNHTTWFSKAVSVDMRGMIYWKILHLYFTNCKNESNPNQHLPLPDLWVRKKDFILMTVIGINWLFSSLGGVSGLLVFIFVRFSFWGFICTQRGGWWTKLTAAENMSKHPVKWCPVHPKAGSKPPHTGWLITGEFNKGNVY